VHHHHTQMVQRIPFFKKWDLFRNFTKSNLSLWVSGSKQNCNLAKSIKILPEVPIFFFPAAQQSKVI
jgi:hypothetical protein